jgi:hypothetical protein
MAGTIPKRSQKSNHRRRGIELFEATRFFDCGPEEFQIEQEISHEIGMMEEMGRTDCIRENR